MRYWWVNQKQTYKHEIKGGFLWSPKNKTSNAGKAIRNQFYENMRLVEPGDLIFSFAHTLIKAVGVATGPALSAKQPETFGSTGRQWHDEGWRVPVRFSEVENPIRPKDYIAELRPHLSKKYAPIQSDGNGNQNVYLAEISEAFANVLLSKLNLKASDFQSDPAEFIDLGGDAAQEAVEGRTDIGPTQIEQLIKARRGQGVFRANVRLNETKCRVTGVTDLRLLIASHIKPWVDSADHEKLDGCNGLLLSPHLDRLFDSGLISFNDDGAMLVSSSLSEDVLEAWQIDPTKKVGSFSAKQSEYLAFHRQHRFKP